MSKKVTVLVEVDQDEYMQAKSILESVGLSFDQAVDLFNAQIVRHKGLSFMDKSDDDQNVLNRTCIFRG